MRRLLLGGIVVSLAIVPAVAPAAAGEIVVFCPGAVQSVVRPMVGFKYGMGWEVPG